VRLAQVQPQAAQVSPEQAQQAWQREQVLLGLRWAQQARLVSAAPVQLQDEGVQPEDEPQQVQPASRRPAGGQARLAQVPPAISPPASEFLLRGLPRLPPPLHRPATGGELSRQFPEGWNWSGSSFQ
jgi:hypothetical protein